MPEKYAIPDNKNTITQNRGFIIKDIVKDILEYHFISNAPVVTILRKAVMLPYILHNLIDKIQQLNKLQGQEYIPAATKEIDIPTLDELKKYFVELIWHKRGNTPVPVESVGEESKEELPNWVWPLSTGSLTSAFGIYDYYRDEEKTQYVKRNHSGIDLSAPAGTVIKAVASGKISDIRKNTDGYGNFIIIDHGNGFTTWYAHMLEAPTQQRDDTVNQNDVIGKVGNTGTSTGNHLHFEIRKNDIAINPLSELGDLPNGITATIAQGFVKITAGVYENWLLK